MTDIQGASIPSSDIQSTAMHEVAIRSADIPSATVPSADISQADIQPASIPSATNRTSFLHLIDAMEQIRRRSVLQAGDMTVMNAEMQMIRAVGMHDGIHVGGLAKLLSITKGAVSQTLSRLSQKGIIAKEPDPANASRLRLHLTDKGAQIHAAHERYHRELNALEHDILESASPKEVAFLERYLTVVGDKINQEYAILAGYLN